MYKYYIISKIEKETAECNFKLRDEAEKFVSINN